MLPLSPRFSTRSAEIWWHDASAPPINRLCVPHADISARATVWRFISEIGRFPVVGRGHLLYSESHRYVDILENFSGRDPQHAVGGLHEVVALLSTMFTSERVPELHGTGELPGPDQKSRPIDLPFALYFPHFIPPLGEGRLMELVVNKMQFCPGWIFCEGEKESTRDPGVRSIPNSCAILKFFAINFRAA